MWIRTYRVRKLPQGIRKRKDIAQRYHKILNGSKFDLPEKKKGSDHVFYRYVVKVQKGRDRILKQLKLKGIQASSSVSKALHQYLGKKGFAATSHAIKSTISLPIYPSLTHKEFNSIKKVLFLSLK